MYIKKEFNFKDLKEVCWSGAALTLETIEKNGKEEELMNLLQVIFTGIPTITEINDFLWFNDDYIFEELEIAMDEEE